MEELIAIHWLRKVFLPSTAPEDPSEWRLLVIDGHHTHTTIDFMTILEIRDEECEGELQT
jgi:hypothetical protein